MSQGEVALASGEVRASYVSMLERGERSNPTGGVLVALARALRTHMVVLEALAMPADELSLLPEEAQGALGLLVLRDLLK